MVNLSSKNIIKIVENKNRLYFEEFYTPVVCGNSNYVLEFYFDNIWEMCDRKTAVFLVEGKKFTVKFDGNFVKVPPLPNAPFFHVALSAFLDDESIINTTAIRIRLEPTPLAANIPRCGSQIESYSLPKMTWAEHL